jgi:hypothetical protein
MHWSRVPHHTILLRALPFPLSPAKFCFESIGIILEDYKGLTWRRHETNAFDDWRELTSAGRARKSRFARHFRPDNGNF